MLTRAMRWAYVVYPWLVLAAVVTQFYLAGLAVFSRASDFETHRSLGFTIGLLTLLGLLLCFAARVPWKTTAWWGVLVVQTDVAQSLLASFRINNPALGAFHVIDAIAIFTIVVAMALQARKLIPTAEAAMPERERERVSA